MIQTVCDHCEKIIVDDDYKNIPITIGGYDEIADLCGKCLGELISLVEGFIDGEDFEIIGNIHDNPELLKGGGEE